MKLVSQVQCQNLRSKLNVFRNCAYCFYLEAELFTKEASYFVVRQKIIKMNSLLDIISKHSQKDSSMHNFQLA